MNAPRYNVIGVGVSALRFAEARDAVIRGAQHGQRGYICCGTAHGLVEAQRDPALKRAYNESWLTTPDGMPLVWLGPRGTERVYGPDLMLAVCDKGRDAGLRHFLFGGQTGVAHELKARLTARFPGLNIVGTATPPFRPLAKNEIDEAASAIAAARAEVVWVGLGSPKQERFMAEHWRRIPGLLIGVGAAFDFHSGRVRQAPRWIRGSGLEWLFRFAIEPRRLGWRYLRTNPLFVAHVLAQKARLRRYDFS